MFSKPKLQSANFSRHHRQGVDEFDCARVLVWRRNRFDMLLNFARKVIGWTDTLPQHHERLDDFTPLASGLPVTAHD